MLQRPPTRLIFQYYTQVQPSSSIARSLPQAIKPVDPIPHLSRICRSLVKAIDHIGLPACSTTQVHAIGFLLSLLNGTDVASKRALYATRLCCMLICILDCAAGGTAASARHIQLRRSVAIVVIPRTRTKSDLLEVSIAIQEIILCRVEEKGMKKITMAGCYT